MMVYVVSRERSAHSKVYLTEHNRWSKELTDAYQYEDGRKAVYAASCISGATVEGIDVFEA